jgi:hypothetical protein
LYPAPSHVAYYVTLGRIMEDCVICNGEACVFCEGVADFIWLEGNGQFRVCVDCIKDGETDVEAYVD